MKDDLKTTGVPPGDELTTIGVPPGIDGSTTVGHPLNCACPIEERCGCGMRPALVIRGDEVRSSVKQFGRDMERKLRKNDHKGGWGGASNAWLVRRMFDEVGELMEAIIAGHPAEDVIDECADVANMVHMIADNARRDEGSWRGV